MRRLATYEGIVEDGRVKLPSDIEIPDKTRVYILVPDSETRPSYIASPRLVHPDQAKDFEMEVTEDTTDAGV